MSYDPNERGSRAQEDLGGGFRAAREGDLLTQNQPAKPKYHKPVNPDAPQLGRPSDVTAPDTALDSNRQHIERIRETLRPAEKGVANVALSGTGVQQELF